MNLHNVAELKSSALFANVTGSQFHFTVQKNINVMISDSFGIPHALSHYPHRAGVARTTGEVWEGASENDKAIVRWNPCSFLEVRIFPVVSPSSDLRWYRGKGTGRTKVIRWKFSQVTGLKVHKMRLSLADTQNPRQTIGYLIVLRLMAP